LSKFLEQAGTTISVVVPANTQEDKPAVKKESKQKTRRKSVARIKNEKADKGDELIRGKKEPVPDLKANTKIPSETGEPIGENNQVPNGENATEIEAEDRNKEVAKPGAKKRGQKTGSAKRPRQQTGKVLRVPCGLKEKKDPLRSKEKNAASGRKRGRPVGSKSGYQMRGLRQPRILRPASNLDLTYIDVDMEPNQEGSKAVPHNDPSEKGKGVCKSESVKVVKATNAAPAAGAKVKVGNVTYVRPLFVRSFTVHRPFALDSELPVEEVKHETYFSHLNPYGPKRVAKGLQSRYLRPSNVGEEGGTGHAYDGSVDDDNDEDVFSSQAFREIFMSSLPLEDPFATSEYCQLHFCGEGASDVIASPNGANHDDINLTMEQTGPSMMAEEEGDDDTDCSSPERDGDQSFYTTEAIDAFEREVAETLHMERPPPEHSDLQQVTSNGGMGMTVQGQEMGSQKDDAKTAPSPTLFGPQPVAALPATSSHTFNSSDTHVIKLDDNFMTTILFGNDGSH